MFLFKGRIMKKGNFKIKEQKLYFCLDFLYNRNNNLISPMIWGAKNGKENFNSR